MRTVARETLFKILFSSQFNDDIDDGFKNSLFKLDKLTIDDIDYCNNILRLINLNEQKLLKLLDEHSTLFPEKRIFPADKSILLIAMCEILYCNDIPDKVSMNEAANIASKYSSAKSASFITGILSTISEKK